MGDVDEATREISRVGGLEGRVGEALAGAVGRVEILQYGQAFLEVRDDRRLDDLARGLRHQAAHPRELLHLRRGSAGARLRHHVDRVERRHGQPVPLLGARDALHHLLGDEVGALGPSIEDLIVFLTLGDQAVEVLALVFLDFVARLGDEALLCFRDDHVVLAERDAGPAGVLKTEPHQPIGEQHGFLLAAVAVDHVDNVRDLFLGEQLVYKAGVDSLVARQDLGNQHSTRRRIDQAGDRVTLGIDALEPAPDLAV